MPKGCVWFVFGSSAEFTILDWKTYLGRASWTYLPCKARCSARLLANELELGVDRILDTSDKQLVYGRRHSNYNSVVSRVVIIPVRFKLLASSYTETGASVPYFALNVLCQWFVLV